MPQPNKFDLGVLKQINSYSLAKSIEAKEKGLREQGKTAADYKVDDEFIGEAVQMDQEFVGDVLSAFATGKYNGENVRIKDILMSTEFPELFGSAVEFFMAQVMPANNTIIDNLFSKVKYSGTSNTITIRTLGGVQIEEVAEGGQYPEQSAAVSDQTFRTSIDIRKYGAKTAATREMIEADSWGIFAFTLLQMKRAIDSYKEKQGYTLFNEMSGHTLKDNVDPASSELGSFTGRGIDGAFNGAAGVDDFMEMIAWHQARGYNPDTFIINPFTWLMWQRDVDTREVLLNGSTIYTPQGSAAPGWGDIMGNLGQPFSRYGSGMASGATAAGAYPVDPIYGKLGIAPYSFPQLTPWGATYQVQPKHLSGTYKIIVSPFVPAYKITGNSNSNLNGKYASNVILADSARCGLLLEKEAPVLEDWRDIEREVEYVKIRTKYGMNLVEQGRGVVVARNIVLDRTYTFDNVNQVTLTPMSTSTARM